MANFFTILFRRDSSLTINQVITKRTVISFFFFFVLMGAGFVGWKWLRNQPHTAEGTSRPLRAVLATNERIFKNMFSDHHLAKEYSRSEAAKNVRVNGDLGLESDLDSNWIMNVVRAPGDTLHVSVEDLKKLPKTEVIFNFKCIEGWSQITWWAGVRFSDFIAAYHLTAQSSMNYVGLSTPDKKYYVGIDMASALHPQTLLAYELNDAPLPLDQGYPLRLIIPVKYGVKHLKRIGTMIFSNEKPPDYWAEKGYDYYTGL